MMRCRQLCGRFLLTYALLVGVLLAPPLNFGASPYFLAYPGTLSLRTSTLLDLAEDLVRSAYSHGFRRILVLNGHSGNDPVRGRLYEARYRGVDKPQNICYTRHITTD